MTFRLRTIDLTSDHREIVRERAIEGDTLTVGRASENAIHLPDLAVEQYHLKGRATAGGKLAIEATGSLGFSLDGRTVTSATIDPREGAELGVGTYRITVAADPDGVASLTVRKAEEAPGADLSPARQFSLGGVLPGKRVMSWALLGAILLAFLAVPVVSSLTREKVKPDIDRQGAVLMDAAWSPGALSSAHHKLEGQCEACHVKPFVAVRDETCLTCHEDISDHAPQSRQLGARGPMSWGDKVQWDVAHAFNKPGPGSCTTCHTEHEGAGRLPATQQQFCSDCHGSLDQRLKDTKIANAEDFGKSHPQFQPAVLTQQGQLKAQRVSLDAKPKQWDGLHFPHEMHLATAGGVARMAQRLGKGAALECSDCHKKTADGVRFAPVNMARDCESCHSLVYERTAAGFQVLSHSNVDKMRAQLGSVSRASHQPVVTHRQRPGQYGAGGIYAANFTPPSVAGTPLSRAMTKEGLCGECHYPSGDGPLGVMKVTQQTRYLVHGWFDHNAHRELAMPDGTKLAGEAACDNCHKASSSQSSTDLLLPNLAQCRTCHLGEAAEKPKVPSSCAMCHSYHPRSGEVAGPPRIAKK